ncbi:hypothetical protein K438DRAFT_1945687 [Mycena galopus ATCC 62051]|nr:hypothetical protein K438DRAFT_1945687 [Mycena galopus ATCC 62051]
MSTAASVIELSPASAVFVDTRTTSLGPWVLGGFLDCILLGVIFCQTRTYFRTRPPVQNTLQQYYQWLVIVVVGLSILKTAQCIGVVWVQNVLDYANPDVARLLVAKAWWQTGIIGVIVQSFFCLRFYMLSRNWKFCVPIVCAMCLGLAGVCFSLANILAGNAKAKVMWLLVHLVGVFVADLFITTGTVYMFLQKRSSGLERTTKLINRLLRLVFESAIPPTVIAMTDLILTQTLGPELLWHLFVNIALSVQSYEVVALLTSIFRLGKVYVVSFLYTLNSINEYRVREKRSQEVHPSGNRHNSPRTTNMELMPRNPGLKSDQIFVQTQVLTHISPLSPTSTMQDKTEYISSGFENPTEHLSSDKASRFGL